jgi:hypothetical protein
MYKFIIASIVTAIIFSVVATGVRADTSLSGKEIKQIISGNTVIGERLKRTHEKEYFSKGVIFKTYFKANGQLVEKGDAFGPASGSSFPAHGIWKVKKKKLCFTFSDSIRNKGKQMCRKVIRKDGSAYELTDGKGQVKRVWKKILPGNPYHLK